MNRNKLLLLTLVSCAGVAQAANEQVYKWTDSQGVTHYSDAEPPKGTDNVQTVRVSGGDRPHEVPINNVEANTTATNSSGANAASANAAASNAKECETARKNLELLQSNLPINIASADGKTQALDDKARPAQIANANAQISLYCK